MVVRAHGHVRLAATIHGVTMLADRAMVSFAVTFLSHFARLEGCVSVRQECRKGIRNYSYMNLSNNHILLYLIKADQYTWQGK